MTACERKIEFLEVYGLLGVKAARVRAILGELSGTVRLIEQPVVAYADCQSQVRGSTAGNEVKE